VSTAYLFISAAMKRTFLDVDVMRLAIGSLIDPEMEKEFMRARNG